MQRTLPPAPDRFEHRFALVSGLRLHYVVGGEDNDDTVVLLAGFPESWYAWRKVMPLLVDRFRVVAVDLPGQGDSDCPSEGYDTQSLATAVHGLLARLELASYFLAGHDVGAWVAFSHAALFSDEVRKLVLLDAGIPGITLPDALPTAPDKAWRTWHFAFHGLADLPELLIVGKEREYLDWFLRRKAASPESFRHADMAEYFRIFSRAGGLRAGLAYYRAMGLSARQNRELIVHQKLKMPILGVSADQGSIADMATPLRAFGENVTGTTIADSGHFIPEEQPATTASALTAFFHD